MFVDEGVQTVTLITSSLCGVRMVRSMDPYTIEPGGLRASGVLGPDQAHREAGSWL